MHAMMYWLSATNSSKMLCAHTHLIAHLSNPLLHWIYHLLWCDCLFDSRLWIIIHIRCCLIGRGSWPFLRATTAFASATVALVAPAATAWVAPPATAASTWRRAAGWCFWHDWWFFSRCTFYFDLLLLLAYLPFSVFAAPHTAHHPPENLPTPAHIQRS